MTHSMEDMAKRLVRHGDLIPCRTAFIDARTPGSDQKENFTIIGPGVAENPDQHIHVAIPHGFNIGGARQPKGCVNSQHSHETEEVFVVHSGQWAFRWGETGRDGEVVLNTGDTISLPVNVFRGFECVSDEPGFLFAILGRDDPGHVTWAPYVFEEAAKHGLVLLQSGRLVDLAAGEVIPEGESQVAATSATEVAAMTRPSLEEMLQCIVTADQINSSNFTALAAGSEGVTEGAILGPENSLEDIQSGHVPRKHGFHLRRLDMAPNAFIPAHKRCEEEVVFVHKGSVAISWAEENMVLNEGDTLTVPINLNRSWRASIEEGAQIFVVRRGDAPAAPEWVESSSLRTLHAKMQAE